MRRQSIVAARWERMLASAPNPASTPDHIRRFTISFSICGSLVTAPVGGWLAAA